METDIPAWALAGKQVLVRLQAHEDNALQTTFFVVNASLRSIGLGTTGG